MEKSLNQDVTPESLIEIWLDELFFFQICQSCIEQGLCNDKKIDDLVIAHLINRKGHENEFSLMAQWLHFACNPMGFYSDGCGNSWPNLKQALSHMRSVEKVVEAFSSSLQHKLALEDVEGNLKIAMLSICCQQLRFDLANNLYNSMLDGESSKIPPQIVEAMESGRDHNSDEDVANLQASIKKFLREFKRILPSPALMQVAGGLISKQQEHAEEEPVNPNASSLVTERSETPDATESSEAVGGANRRLVHDTGKADLDDLLIYRIGSMQSNRSFDALKDKDGKNDNSDEPKVVLEAVEEEEEEEKEEKREAGGIPIQHLDTCMKQTETDRSRTGCVSLSPGRCPPASNRFGGCFPSPLMRSLLKILPDDVSIDCVTQEEEEDEAVAMKNRKDEYPSGAGPCRGAEARLESANNLKANHSPGFSPNRDGTSGSDVVVVLSDDDDDDDDDDDKFQKKPANKSRCLRSQRRKETNSRKWSEEEARLLLRGVKVLGPGNWSSIREMCFPGRSRSSLRDKWKRMKKGNPLLNGRISS